MSEHSRAMISTNQLGIGMHTFWPKGIGRQCRAAVRLGPLLGTVGMIQSLQTCSTAASTEADGAVLVKQWAGESTLTPAKLAGFDHSSQCAPAVSPSDECSSDVHSNATQLYPG